MSEWTALIAANQRACPTVRDRRTALNDILCAAWAMEPRTQAERRELERLERAVILAVPRIETTKYGGCNPIGGRVR